MSWQEIISQLENHVSRAVRDAHISLPCEAVPTEGTSNRLEFKVHRNGEVSSQMGQAGRDVGFH